jgi:hypothetical protein
MMSQPKTLHSKHHYLLCVGSNFRYKLGSLMAMNIIVIVFWVMMTCNLVDAQECFGGTQPQFGWLEREPQQGMS